MFINAHISYIYFFWIGHIVYEIRQVATLPAWSHYPSFPYAKCIIFWILSNKLLINAQKHQFYII